MKLWNFSQFELIRPFYGPVIFKIYSINSYGPEMYEIYKKNGHGPAIIELYRKTVNI